MCDLRVVVHIDRSPATAGLFCVRGLRARPFDRPPQLKGIATLLNTSEHRLTRRLQEEGACFGDISNAVRKTHAQALVAEGRLSIKENRGGTGVQRLVAVLAGAQALDQRRAERVVAGGNALVAGGMRVAVDPPARTVHRVGSTPIHRPHTE